MKKRYVSIILVICLLIGAILPTMAFSEKSSDVQETEYSETSETVAEDYSYSEDVDATETENSSESEDADEGASETEDAEESLPETEDADEGASGYEDLGEGVSNPEDFENDTPKGGNVDTGYSGGTVGGVEEDYSLFLHIAIDHSRNAIVASSEEIGFLVLGGDGEGNITIALRWDNPQIRIGQIDISFDMPAGWTYEIDSFNQTITVTPSAFPPYEEERPEIYINVDEERNVITSGTEGIRFAVVDENGEGNFTIMLQSVDSETEVSEADITVNVPAGWAYEIEAGNHTITIITSENVERPEIYISVDDEHNVTVIVSEGIAYEVLDENDDEDSIVVMLMSHSPEIEIYEDDISVDLSMEWEYKIDSENDFVIVTLSLEELMALGIAMVNGEVFTITHRAWDRASLNTAIGPNGREAVIAIERDILLAGLGGFTIQSNSNITIISDPDAPGGPFTITQNGSNTRHFTVDGILCLANVTLNTAGAPAGGSRGGVRVNTTGHLIINEGGAITNSRWANRGGGVFVTGSGALTMNGGRISGNHVPVNNADYQNGGGGVYLEGNSRFIMNGGVITQNTTTHFGNGLWQGGGGVLVNGAANFTMNGGEISSNTASREGGGINIGPNATVTMYGGSIVRNMAESVMRGGGGVWVTGGSFTTANRPDSDTVTTKIISFNRTRGHGGGIGSQREEAGQFTGFSGIVTIVDGTTIEGNRSGVDDVPQAGRGLGGGVLMHGGASLVMTGGEIINNIATREGGGVAIWNARATLSGGEIRGNHTNSNGGGIALSSAGSDLIMSGGTINGNTADNNGGGINIPDGPSTFNMSAGTISGNTANSGGGLHVNHDRLSNINIAEAAVFTRNIAREGIKVDNGRAEANRTRIRPGTVSLPLAGTFAHAFTNYDINAEGTLLQFYQVTFEVGSGEGEITAKNSSTNAVIGSGNFVPGGTEIIFTADPASQFQRWEVGTRPNAGAPFDFIDGGVIMPLTRTINTHTHVIGHFGEAPTTLSVSKTIRGVMSNMDREFDFTISFRNSDGSPLGNAQFNYLGDIIAGSGATAPPDGVLISDGNGSANFRLGHGQVIIIEGVFLGSQVRIIEEPGPGYTASFRDSENESTVIIGNDTDFRTMTKNRVFRFTNEREIAPPTGVALGDTGTILLLAGAASLSALGMSVIYAVYHRRKRVRQ